MIFASLGTEDRVPQTDIAEEMMDKFSFRKLKNKTPLPSGKAIDFFLKNG